MDWAALFGGLIGATIPGSLTYLGLRRSRQATDAQTLGPAMLLPLRMQPDRIMFNINNDPSAEAARLQDLADLTHAARERLSSSGQDTRANTSVPSPTPPRPNSRTCTAR